MSKSETQKSRRHWEKSVPGDVRASPIVTEPSEERLRALKRILEDTKDEWTSHNRLFEEVSTIRSMSLRDFRRILVELLRTGEIESRGGGRGKKKEFRMTHFGIESQDFERRLQMAVSQMRMGMQQLGPRRRKFQRVFNLPPQSLDDVGRHIAGTVSTFLAFYFENLTRNSQGSHYIPTSKAMLHSVVDALDDELGRFMFELHKESQVDFDALVDRVANALMWKKI